ncbi:MAG: MFS transporter [Chloroflexi bacterium]|nr:MFS transporter [Chloroflexota bacterium]
MTRARTGWTVMGMVWTFDLFVWVSAFSIGVLLPKMREDMHIADWQAGLLGSSFFLVFFALSIPTSIWLSRLRPKTVIFYSALATGGFVLLQGFAHGYAMLLTARFGFVIAATARNAMVPLLMQQWFDARRIPLLNSIFNGVTGLGQVLVLGLSPYLLLVTSWRAIYWIDGGGLLLLGLVWLMYGQDRESPEHPATLGRQTGRSPLGVIWREKALWLAAGAQMGVAFAGSSVMTFWPTYAKDERHFALTTIGNVMLSNPIFMVIGSAFTGVAMRLVPKRKVLLIVPWLTLPLVFLGVIYVKSIPVLVLLFAVNGLAQAMTLPVLMSVPYQLGLSQREVSVATGHMRTFVPLGGALGPLFVGLVAGATSLRVAMTIACPLALSLVVFSRFLPDRPPEVSTVGVAGPQPALDAE